MAAILFSPLYFPVTNETFNCKESIAGYIKTCIADMQQILRSYLEQSLSSAFSRGGSSPKIAGCHRQGLEKSTPLLSKPHGRHGGFKTFWGLRSVKNESVCDGGCGNGRYKLKIGLVIGGPKWIQCLSLICFSFQVTHSVCTNPVAHLCAEFLSDYSIVLRFDSVL